MPPNDFDPTMELHAKEFKQYFTSKQVINDFWFNYKVAIGQYQLTVSFLWVEDFASIELIDTKTNILLIDLGIHQLDDIKFIYKENNTVSIEYYQRTIQKPVYILHLLPSIAIQGSVGKPI